jgi:16S rRNA G966 N2-methylase RsmD
MNQVPSIASYLSKLQELDWDFQGDKSDSPFSDLHFHPGRFVPQIPAALIGTLTRPKEIVLDPFCGSGTTLVEAQRLGRDAIGFDLNPVACLISRVKCQAKAADQIDAEFSSFLKLLATSRVEHFTGETPTTPSTVQLSKWYHPETGRQLTSIWHFIQSHRNLEVGDLALFCFSAALMACCGETRTWGYICDNVRPLEHRYVDAYSVFFDRGQALIEAFRRRDSRRLSADHVRGGSVSVVQGDAVAALRSLPDESIHLVVTSPPYFGVIDYVKAQRLTFEWFGLQIEPYRRNEIGARSKRHRTAAISQYLEELRSVAEEIHRVLKRGHAAAFVIGESSKREGAVHQFVKVLEETGFEISAQVTRSIGLLRRQPASLAKEELILCLRA